MIVAKTVDLSLALDADTQVYPGDPQVMLEGHSTIARDGFNLLSVAMGSQSGTNCDAPYHFLDSGARIDDVDLALFAGPAVIIDVRGLDARTTIEVQHVAPYLDRLAPGVIVVLNTGWSAHYRTPMYFDHPYLSAPAAAAILDTGARTICLDTPNIDETPDGEHPGVGFPVHLLVARVGGIVVENLTNLQGIDFPEPFVTVFPLRLTAADGGPCRAVALQLAVPNP